MTGSEPLGGVQAVHRRVEELLPVLAERAVGSDRDARLAPSSVDDLAAAGAFALLQPRRYGGHEASPVDFFRLVRRVSSVCVSTGWVLGSLGVAAWHVGLFEAAAQDEVWRARVNTRVCSAHAPIGRLRRAPDGGLRLSGSWRFASGAEVSEWAVLAAVEVDGDGRPLDVFHVLVRQSDLRAKVSATGGGLRGTGCLDLSTEGLDVPLQRVVRVFDVARLRAPGRAVNRGALHGMPWGLMHTHAVTAPVVGAAQGSFWALREQGREELRLSMGGTSLDAGARLRAGLGRAATDIDASVLQTERNLEEAYAAALAGVAPDLRLRLRARRDQVRATERCVEAVDLLFADRRRLSVRRGGPVERAWRDVHAARTHAANDGERAYDLYGAHELGLSVEDDLL